MARINTDRYLRENATAVDSLKLSGLGASEFARTVHEHDAESITSGKVKPERLTFGNAAGTICSGDDARLADAREWTAETVSDTEAAAGTSSTRRAWTPSAVRAAITGWWAIVGTAMATIEGVMAFASNASNLSTGTVAKELIPTLNQSTSGNAATATKLAAARNFAISGAVTAEPVAFDGSQNVTFSVTALDPAALSTVPFEKGGTTQTTRQGAINALAGASTANRFLKGDGTNIVLGQVELNTLDVIGITPVAKGGSGSDSAQFAMNTFAGGVTANRVLKGNGTNIVLAQIDLSTPDTIGLLPLARVGTGARVVFSANNIHTSVSPDSHVSGVQGADVNIDTGVKGWQFFTSIRPDNAGFGTQLALCDTQNGIKYRRRSSAAWQAWQELATLEATQTFTGSNTFTSVLLSSVGIRAGLGATGNIRMSPGGAANAGYLEIYKTDGTTRIGFIGYDNTNLNYTAEGGAIHNFAGGRVDIIGGVAPPTTRSCISSFVSGTTTPLTAFISAPAATGYRAYEISNAGGVFGIKRINDAYNAVLGNILTHSATNVLEIGNAGTRALGTYGSLTVQGSVSTYAGIHFPAAADGAIIMMGTASRNHGVWSPTAGWHYHYNAGNLKIHSSDAATEGTFIGLNKGLGALPGYPANRHPTLITDFSQIYISVGGAYSATISTNGTYTAVSDMSRKTVVEEIVGDSVLRKIARLPINRYHFKDEDERITRIGPFAQDFWREFECGGNQEIIDDESPTSPNKMIATSDVAGVCLAAIKQLTVEMDELKAKFTTQ